MTVFSAGLFLILLYINNSRLPGTCGVVAQFMRGLFKRVKKVKSPKKTPTLLRGKIASSFRFIPLIRSSYASYAVSTTLKAFYLRRVKGKFSSGRLTASWPGPVLSFDGVSGYRSIPLDDYWKAGELIWCGLSPPARATTSTTFSYSVNGVVITSADCARMAIHFPNGQSRAHRETAHRAAS